MNKTNRTLLRTGGMPLLAALAITILTVHLEAATDATSIAPADKAPFKVPADPAEKKALVDAIKQYMELPPEQVKAHPAAADFPGIAPAGAPRVTRDVALTFPLAEGGAGRHGGWQSTGL